MNNSSEESLIFDPAARRGTPIQSLLQALGGALVVWAILLVVGLFVTTKWLGMTKKSNQFSPPTPEFISQISFRNDLVAHEAVAEGSPFPAEGVDLEPLNPADAFVDLQRGLVCHSFEPSIQLLSLSTHQLEQEEIDRPLAQIQIHEVDPLALPTNEKPAIIEHTVATLFLQIEGAELKALWPKSRARSFEIPQGLELPTWPGVSMKVGVVGKTGLVEFCAPLDDTISVGKSRALTRWIKQLQFERSSAHLVWGEARIWQKQIKLDTEPSSQIIPSKKTP